MDDVSLIKEVTGCLVYLIVNKINPVLLRGLLKG